MAKSLTRVHRLFRKPERNPAFRTGVSLHSHTMHSREGLERLPVYIAKFPIGHYVIEREIGRLHLYENRVIDFGKYYWTPPLSPREAWTLEREQIETYGLAPIVSLTDHDNIEASLRLRMLTETSGGPISVEWTVPYAITEFHIGVHNLPASRAKLWMSALADYTAKPRTDQLRDILAGLNDERNVLLVLNHPYWDAEGVGAVHHRDVLLDFLQNFLPWLHAIELNGMRSRRENREVLQLGEELEFPVISGGDRHGCEPNATLNFTQAESFEEFIHEIRYERQSDIALMPQFFEPLTLRLIENAWHALSDAPGEFGRRSWMTRVFVEENGEAIPFSNFNGTRFHRIIEKFRWIIGLVANPVVRPAIRLAFLGNEEGGL
ncbi:MAG TPA: hypothetical protein VMT75_10020 [Candidatus Saccharimonadales bacterium]|nr:hypothetical protein [Candidatus Saccharimonadales bacterium]